MKTLGFIRVVLGLVLVCGAGACANKPQPPPQDARAVAPSSGEAATGEACGPTKCSAAEVCCNASCGICTPPGGMCTQQFCEPEAPQDPRMNPDGQAHKGPAGEGACKDDADCHAASDYCTGCDCRPLGPQQSVPACAGPGVRCLLDPCEKRVAVCIQGYCQLKPRG